MNHMISICYGIKSWLDIDCNHVAIVHCSNGRTRTGVVIACLLKYIGMMSTVLEAFEFFCGAR